MKERTQEISFRRLAVRVNRRDGQTISVLLHKTVVPRVNVCLMKLKGSKYN